MSDEYAEDPHGAGDVLELARTFVREADVELATQFLAHATLLGGGRWYLSVQSTHDVHCINDHDDQFGLWQVSVL